MLIHDSITCVNIHIFNCFNDPSDYFSTWVFIIETGEISYTAKTNSTNELRKDWK
jgi:hypothetical protein